jgi:transaldolase
LITDQISGAGTSIWLDDLSRSKITGSDSYSLPHRIAHNNVVGVTTNPSIFNSAISTDAEYASSIASLKGYSAEDVVRILTTDDVRNACDLFAPIFTSSLGFDGRVSIEVDARLAHDTQKSIEQGRQLWKLVDRPNVMIKIPATLEGLDAISVLSAEGISVNVTLIFSVERYVKVFEAFMKGLEMRISAGESLAEVTSVASLFVSRVDTAVDAILKKENSPSSTALLGKAAIANAILTYQAFEALSTTPRWKALESKGARIQRPLWASTGVKNPAYEDTRYVLELVAPNTVNTMPQATLDAVIDHGVLGEEKVDTEYAKSQSIFYSLEEVGVSMSAVTDELEKEGVKKFADAWNELLANVGKALSE